MGYHLKIKQDVMMKTIVYLHFIVVLVCWSSVSSADKEAVVTIVPVQLKSLNYEIMLPASAESVRQSDVSSKVSGIVKKIYVEEGQWIKAGEKILSIDSELEKLQLEAVRAQLDEAKVKHKDLLRQKNEYQLLEQKKAVSTTSFASAVADEESARAGIARVSALLRRQQAVVSRHELYAPFDGIVAAKYIDNGEWLKNESRVIRLAAVDKIRVRTFLPQRYYHQVDLNAAVRVVFDALKEQVYHSESNSLVALANENARHFPLLSIIDNADNKIAPGMSAKIYIALKKLHKKVPVVPADAVILKPNGSRLVWKLVRRGQKHIVQPINVIAGRRIDHWLEISSEQLNPGDQVVLLGNENLRPGQQVKTVNH